jgi:Virulence activator alpha C-term
MRLLTYQQNGLSLSGQGTFRHDNKRPNPYGAASQEDTYLSLVTRFAIDFEKMYLQWLYEALDMVEPRQEQMPERGE